jgi:hypothetical protein
MCQLGKYSCMTLPPLSERYRSETSIKQCQNRTPDNLIGNFGGGACQGRLRNTIQCVARVAGCSETALSEGCFRLRVINPLKGLFTTFTGAVGGDWIVDTLERRTVVRKPTLPSGDGRGLRAEGA